MVAQRRGWRYFATRLNGDGTETNLDVDLPLQNVSIEDVLSGDNALTGDIDPVYRRLKDPLTGLPVLREYSTAIYAENDGDIRCGGILTHSQFDGPNWGLEATGFTGYGRDMPWTTGAPVVNTPSGWNIPAGKDGSGFGVQVDPIDMGRVIWNHIQSHPGGNIGLQFESTTTGGVVKIGTTLKQVEFDSQSGPVSFEAGPFKLNWYSSHDLQGIFDDLANEAPFDYHERHYWKPDGTIGHFVEIGYPKIGTKRNDLRFIFGVNVWEPVKSERDGAMYASGTMVLGSGDGAAMIKSIQEPPTRPDGRLRRVQVVIDDTIRSRKKADARARAENQWRARLDDLDTLVVQDHPHARLGSVKVGDEIRVEGEGDWLGLDVWVRILSISYQPENGNIAEYRVARTDKLLS